MCSITVNRRNDKRMNYLDVSFEEFTEEKQKAVFLNHKDVFLFQALISPYLSIRNLARKHASECSPNTLHKAIHRLEVLGEVRKALQLLNISSEIDSELRNDLSYSIYWEIRLWVASNTGTPSELLINMLLRENTACIKEAIMKNPNFDASLLP